MRFVVVQCFHDLRHERILLGPLLLPMPYSLCLVPHGCRNLGTRDPCLPCREPKLRRLTKEVVSSISQREQKTIDTNTCHNRVQDLLYLKPEQSTVKIKRNVFIKTEHRSLSKRGVAAILRRGTTRYFRRKLPSHLSSGSISTVGWHIPHIIRRFCTPCLFLRHASQFTTVQGTNTGVHIQTSRIIKNNMNGVPEAGCDRIEQQLSDTVSVASTVKVSNVASIESSHYSSTKDDRHQGNKDSDIRIAPTLSSTEANGSNSGTNA
jgi:hypothetical protein